MIYLALVITASSLGQYFLKLSTRPGKNKLQIVSVIFFVCATLLGIFSVRSVGLYSTYMAAALSYVMTSVLGKVLLNEQFGLKKVVGLSLIIFGVTAFGL